MLHLLFSFLLVFSFNMRASLRRVILVCFVKRVHHAFAVVFTFSYRLRFILFVIFACEINDLTLERLALRHESALMLSDITSTILRKMFLATFLNTHAGTKQLLSRNFTEEPTTG